jgi:hypothetical protein
MYICYFDESGDSGLRVPPLKHHSWFILNCIIVKEIDWLETLNLLVKMRQYLRDEHGLPVRSELKGVWFKTGEGIFSGLNIKRRDRMEIYKWIMEYESTLPILTFSVAINKSYALDRGWNVRYCAWDFALNRLNVACCKTEEKCVLYPDDGQGMFITRCVRSMRRHNYVPKRYGPGSLRLPTERILEDPSDRKSICSYYVQMADLNTYATHRSIYIDPVNKMKRDMWDVLGSPVNDIRLLAVNENTGGWPPGIKTYPTITQNPA